MSKKLIAGAGVVASLAVALAPLATFATVADGTTIGAQEDELEITILPACDFGYDINGDGDYEDTDELAPVTHTDGTNGGAWDANAPDYTAAVYTGEGDARTLTTPGAGSDTLSRTMTAGTTDADLGKTHLTVFCNNTTGYRVTALGTNLVRTVSDTTPIVAAASASSVTGLWSSTNTSKWSYSVAFTSNAKKVTSTNPNGTAEVLVTEDSELAAPASATPIFKNTAATDADGDKLDVTYSVGLVDNQGAGTYTGTMTYTLIQGQES